MTRNLLITGIPRSGTSYLCAILNAVRNSVVINEPEEIFQLLRIGSNLGLSAYYNQVRRQISDGRPIANKIINGAFIEDTNIVDARNFYVPEVDTGDFILGTKNTLIYLNALQRILTDLPDIVVLACVRHPYHTIASWRKVSFGHIRNAEPRFLLDYTCGAEKQAVQQLLQVRDIATRYAMWWKQLAETIHTHRERILIINYENMVCDPRNTLKSVFAPLGFPLEERQALKPSQPRQHQNALDPVFATVIDKICKGAAQQLGYDL